MSILSASSHREAEPSQVLRQIGAYQCALNSFRACVRKGFEKRNHLNEMAFEDLSTLKRAMKAALDKFARFKHIMLDPNLCTKFQKIEMKDLAKEAEAQVRICQKLIRRL